MLELERNVAEQLRHVVVGYEDSSDGVAFLGEGWYGEYVQDVHGRRARLSWSLAMVTVNGGMRRERGRCDRRRCT